MGLTMRQDGESVRAHIPWLVEGPCALTRGLSAITEKCHQQPGNLTGRFIKMSQRWIDGQSTTKPLPGDIDSGP